MICGPRVDFKKLRHWTNPCASRARKEDSFTGHTKQHPLGNSDLKTSSDESSHRVCRTAPPTSCRTSAGGPVLLKVRQASPRGGFSWGGHVAFAQFPFSRKPFETFGWEPPLKKSPSTWCTRVLLVPSCRSWVGSRCRPSPSNVLKVLASC